MAQRQEIDGYDELELGQTTNQLISIFHALSHPVRFSICKELLASPYSVGELCALLGLKQYAVSQQLAVLRGAGLLNTERQSRHIIYSLKSDVVRRILRVSICNAGLDDASVQQAQKPRASGFARIVS